MSICSEFRKNIVDFIENQVSDQQGKRFREHLHSCELCQNEYSKVVKLYKILNEDEVVLPEKEFFDNVKAKVRQRELVLPKYSFKKLAKVFVPVCVAAIILLVLLNRPRETIEMSISTATLLEDKEIAQLSLSGVITDELINELSTAEEYLPFEVDETIDELSEEERNELIENLYKKYGNNI